ncbi:MAG: metallophosphoesterase [Clostridia bacterium]|nr:metallophosphoesterase [Clostridia bacterium]
MKTRKWLRRLLVLALLAGLVLAALDDRLIVRRYAIEAEELSASVRLAVLTDFHEEDYGEGAAVLLEAVAAEEPHLVLLVGDMFADGGDFSYAAGLMRALAADYPTYYVTGNHEYWTDQIDHITALVQDAGVTVLDQACEVVSVNGQQLALCGVPDPYAMVYAGAPDTPVQLAHAMAGAPGGLCTVLMAHRPELIEKYAAAGFDLVLSGHAHGGQVRIPLLLNGLCAPNQGWFPAYAGGLYTREDTTLIVSRGLSRQAQWYVPRIFNRPELVIVDLK